MTIQYKDVRGGTYPGLAKKWGYQKASTGTEGLAIEFEVRVPTGAPVPEGSPEGTPAPYDIVAGGMIKTLYFTDGAMETSMRALAALGAWPDGASDEERAAAIGLLYRQQGALPEEVDLVVDVVNETYTDPKTGETKKRNGPQIQFVNRKGGGGIRITDATEADLQAATNRIAQSLARLKARAASNAGSPRPSLAGNKAAAASATPVAQQDDDIPF